MFGSKIMKIKCTSYKKEVDKYKKIGIPFYKKPKKVCLKCYRDLQTKLNAKAGTKLTPEQLEQFRAKHKATKEARKSKEEALEQIKQELPSESDKKEEQSIPIGVG
jgi:threonine synthase